jgi:hypothetical protein
MKKPLTLLFVLTLSTLAAQELTADTPAVAAGIDWSAELLKIILSVLGMVLMRVASQAIPLLNAWLKQVMHFRGASVVADALTQAFGELLAEAQTAASDGVITADELKAIKARAREIALNKLKNLSGFYKKDLIGWLDEVLEVELGKLLSRVFGFRSFDSKTL